MRLTPIALAWLAVVALGGCNGGSAPQSLDAAPPDGGPPDVMTTCPPTPPPVCDYFLSCGCEAPTPKCSAGASGPTCFMAGPGLPGDSCPDETWCAPGETCAAYFGSSICLQFCDDAHPCGPSPTGGDQVCYVTINDRESPPKPIGHACGQACSLLKQDCQFTGQGCYYSTEFSFPAEEGECVLAGTGTQGASCFTANDCAAGTICVNTTGSTNQFCAKLCDRTGSDPKCDTGSCQPLQGEVKTGICLAP